MGKAQPISVNAATGGGENAKDPEDHMVSRSTRTKVVNDIKTVTITETYQKPNGEKYDVTITRTENTADGTTGKETKTIGKSSAEPEKPGIAVSQIRLGLLPVA